jgi:predicted DNA-binding transcriptional regulator AlpA
MKTDIADELLSTKQAAQFLHLSVQTLADMRSAGSGPPFVKLSRSRVAYLRSDLVEYATTRRVRSTTEARLRGLDRPETQS